MLIRKRRDFLSRAKTCGSQIVEGHSGRLKATLDAETRHAREAAANDNHLKEEHASPKHEQDNLVDAMAKHGFSAALSAKLGAVESRLAQIQRLRDAGVEPKVPEFTIKEIRDFAERKSQEFANVLAGDAATAREQLRNRVTKLVLMPKQTPNGPVFEVTGDVSLFQGDCNVMLTNSLAPAASLFRDGFSEIHLVAPKVTTPKDQHVPVA